MDNELVKKKIIERLESTKNPEDNQIESIIEECVFDYAMELYLGTSYITGVIREIKGELLGFGILQGLFEDSSITEIMVNGTEVFYEKNGRLFQADFKLGGTDETLGIIRAICRKTSRTVNSAVPITDACLTDGTRINIVMEPICVDGHTMTIRKFPKIPLSAQELIANGLCTKDAMNFLKNIYRAKYNIFIWRHSVLTSTGAAESAPSVREMWRIGGAGPPAPGTKV